MKQLEKRNQPRRIAAATVIRGSGACRAYMDGIVNEELQRMADAHARELAAVQAERSANQAHRNRLLAEKLEADRRALRRRPGLARRWLERVRDAWALGYATFFAVGEFLGLWELLEGSGHADP